MVPFPLPLRRYGIGRGSSKSVSSPPKNSLLTTTGVGASSPMRITRTASLKGSSPPSEPVPLGTSRLGLPSVASFEGSNGTSPAPLGASRREWGPDSLLGCSVRNGAISGKQTSRQQYRRSSTL